MRLYVAPMDCVVVDFSPDGQIQIENEEWSRPTLQEQRAVIYAAREEIERLTELVETLETIGRPPGGAR
jgi:hypothetical protein